MGVLLLFLSHKSVTAGGQKYFLMRFELHGPEVACNQCVRWFNTRISSYPASTATVTRFFVKCLSTAYVPQVQHESLEVFGGSLVLCGCEPDRCDRHV